MCIKCRLRRRIKDGTIPVDQHLITTPAAYKLWSDLLLKFNDLDDGEDGFGAAIGDAVMNMSIDELAKMMVAIAIVRQSAETIETGVIMTMGQKTDELYGTDEEDQDGFLRRA